LRRVSLTSLGRPALACAPAALGLALGISLADTYPGRVALPGWLLWAPSAIALSGAAGAVFTYGLHRWVELAALHPVSARDAAVRVSAIAAAGLLVVNFTLPLAGSHLGDWRRAALTTIAIIGAVPAGAVMYGIRRAALGGSLPGIPGERLALLVDLRRLLQRLLAAVGSLVALAVLQTGTLMALDRSAHAPSGNGPPQYVLVFGGVGSLLVALIYVPAWAAVQRSGLLLRDELFPMRDLEEPAAVLSMAEDRQKLERILGGDRSVFADIQTGLVILAPLLASAAASFLPQ
jgi:hypothetical protein